MRLTAGAAVEISVEGSRIVIQPVIALPVSTAVATAEDTILAKLEWGKAGGSQRQLDDVVAMIRVQEHLDLDYLHRWALELGIADDLEQAFDLASG